MSSCVARREELRLISSCSFPHLPLYGVMTNASRLSFNARHPCLSRVVKAFSAMQIIATLLVSIAMVILMGTLFFPEARVRIYGLIGGGLFLLYSFFQLVAVSLFAKLRNSLGICEYEVSSPGAALYCPKLSGESRCRHEAV